MIERENMPEISNFARESFGNDLGNTKQFNPQITTEKSNIVIKICQSCEKEYNKTLKDQIIAKLSEIENFDYSHKCLNCIQAELKVIKTDKNISIAEVNKKLTEIKSTYYQLDLKHKELNKIYKEYDYQDHMISSMLKEHEQKTTVKKKSSKKPSKTTDQLREDLARKILKSLSAEQRNKLIANMNI